MIKKAVKTVFVLLMIISLYGCSAQSFSDIKNNLLGDMFATDLHEITQDDSIVSLDIYPEKTGFKSIGKFDRYQFKNLTELQQKIYIILDNAAYSMQNGYVSVGKCTYSDLKIAYYALRCDRPEYFWLPSTYTIKTNGNYLEFCFALSDDAWLCTKEERAITEQQIKSDLTNISKKSDGLSEYERELLAHDWLCKKLSYDREALQNPDGNQSAWTIQGAFSKGKAVCEGYSRAMQVLCLSLGIDCTVATGVTTEAHMWNMVNIDEQWYHLDVTSNDSGDKGFHTYFNVPDEHLKFSHKIDTDLSLVLQDQVNDLRFNNKLPRCSSLENNFVVKSSGFISNKSAYKPTVISLITSAARNKTNFVEIGFSPEMNFVFGRDSVDKFGNLSKIISEVNQDLPSKLKIKKYHYSGLNNSLGFVIYW